AITTTGMTFVPAAAVAEPPPPTRVELTDKRQPQSRTFELSDDTFETEVFGSPVYYRDDTTATLQPIDSSLEEVYTVRGRSLRNKANAFTVDLPMVLDESWTSIESTTGRVAWRPANRPALPEAALVSNSMAIRDRVAPSRAIYPGAFQGATLEYVSLPEGLKETIVLDRYIGRNVFGFDLVAEGVTPELKPDGSIGFYSKESTTPVYVMAAPFMCDSGNDKAGPATSRAVHYRLTEALTGWRLDVVADREWLADDSRVWPVRIDPTVRYAWIDVYQGFDSAFTTNLYPTLNFNPANWGEDGTFPLKVGKLSGYYYHSYLKSDALEAALQELRDLETDVEILYTRLAAQCYIATPSPSTVKYSKVTSYWNPSTITWNAEPTAVYRGAFSQEDDHTSDGLFLTDIVKEWFANPGTNYGIELWGDPGWVKYIGVDGEIINGYFYPGTYHPVYKIAWTTVPEVGLVAPISDTLVDGQPTLVWKYDDAKHRLAAGDGSLISKPQKRVQIQFSTRPDEGAILKDYTPPDTDEYDFTVPTSVYQFSPGQRYFWRMRAAGESNYPVAGDITWSKWTEWAGFTTATAVSASDSAGIEAHRASEPLGAGAAVELKTGALIIARQDLGGPARGGSLTFGTTYRSDTAGSAELPLGWRAPLARMTIDDNRAPDADFSELPTTGAWQTSWGTATASRYPTGRSGTCLKITSIAQTNAYVSTHAQTTSAMLPVWPGQRLRASTFVRTNDPASPTTFSVERDIGCPDEYGALVKIHFFDAAGGYLGQARSGNYTQGASSTWTQISLAADAPDGAYFAKMNIEFKNAWGTLYVDDAYFGDGAFAFTDADGTTHQASQRRSGKFTRDPLANSAGFGLTNLAKNAKITTPSTSINAATDPGFEYPFSAGKWYVGAPTIATQQTVTKRSGTGGLFFTSTAYASGYLTPTNTTSNMLQVSTGNVVRASMWVNTRNFYRDPAQTTEGGAMLKIHFLREDGSLVSTSMSPIWATVDTNGWQEIALSASAPAGATRAKFNVEYRYAKGDLWVDDVEFGFGTIAPGRSVDGDSKMSATGYDTIPVDAAGNSYMTYDLASSRTFSKVSIALWDFQDHPWYGMKVAVSDNGTTWTEVVAPGSPVTARSGRFEADFAAVKARYVRLYALSSYNGRNLRVTELEVPQYTLGHAPVFFDSSGRASAYADNSGNIIYNTFDASSRLLKVNDAAGHEIGLSYTSGELTTLSWTGRESGGTLKAESGRVTYAGGASANTTLTVSANDKYDGSAPRTVVQYHYDALSKIDRIADADGVAIQIIYTAGKVTSASYADGSVKSLSYGTGSATVTTSGGTEAVVTRTTYDTVTQRVLKTEVDPNGKDLENTVTYDCYGGVRKTTDPLLHWSETIRDGHGNVTRTNDIQGRKTTAVYNNDLVVESRDVKDNVSAAEYDDARRLLSAASAISEAPADEDGGESANSNTYDAYGNKTLGDLPGSTAVNLALDPCFSSNVTIAGSGWDGIKQNATSISSIGTPYLGSYYVKLYSPTAESFRASDKIAIDPERSYMVSAWTRGKGMIRILEYDKNGALAHTRWPVLFTGATTGDFSRASGVYWPHSDAVKVEVQLWAGPGDEAHVDNVRFEMATKIGADNFVNNASFESASGELPVRWDPRSSSRTNAMQKVTWDVAVAGARSAFIKTVGSYSTNDGYFYSDWIRVNPGERYSISGNIKTKGLLGKAHIDALYYDTNGGLVVGRDEIGSATGTSEWSRHVGNTIVPPSGV
ncbi:MAG: DNRLRE domain-containing protein, partial [Actinobacteria bacterium]|nr:DNRLRE domain-containing protein [Actinomycetota bacterium]